MSDKLQLVDLSEWIKRSSTHHKHADLTNVLSEPADDLDKLKIIGHFLDGTLKVGG